MAFTTQHGVRPSVTPPGMTMSEASQPVSPIPIRVRVRWRVAVSAPVLADDHARGDRPSRSWSVSRSASPRRAYQFPG
jgi:hypothetical protein